MLEDTLLRRVLIEYCRLLESGEHDMEERTKSLHTSMERISKHLYTSNVTNNDFLGDVMKETEKRQRLEDLDMKALEDRITAASHEALKKSSYFKAYGGEDD